MTDLLSAIEAHIETTGISPTAFGVAALSDRHLVRQMRAGRRLYPETETRVRTFIRDDLIEHEQRLTNGAKPVSPDKIGDRVGLGVV